MSQEDFKVTGSLGTVTPIVPGLDISSPPRHSGGNGGGPSMETRLRGVEDAVIEIKAKLPTLATGAELQGLRADLHQGISNVVMWIAGTVGIGIIGLILAGVSIYFSAKSNNTPPPQAPVVIYQPTPAQK